MAYKDVIKPIPMTFFNSALLTGSYQPINPNGLPYACLAIAIKNYSDFIIDISFDGLQSHEILGIHEELSYGFQKNSRPSNYVAMLSKGTRVYVMDGGAGFKGGYIYLTGWYLQ